jgi:hypothetical protein
MDRGNLTNANAASGDSLRVPPAARRKGRHHCKPRVCTHSRAACRRLGTGTRAGVRHDARAQRQGEVLHRPEVRGEPIRLGLSAIGQVRKFRLPAKGLGVPPQPTADSFIPPRRRGEGPLDAIVGEDQGAVPQLDSGPHSVQRGLEQVLRAISTEVSRTEQG